MSEPERPADVLGFWRDAGPARWFTPDPAFDELCRRRYLPAYDDAVASRLAGWEENPDGALALVILLDQMPRNMFRGTPRVWQADPLALAAAERALANGYDAAVDAELRPFLYLPFMHAEDLRAQERSVALFETLGAADNLRFARHHHAVVARFGRFPHRNDVLRRPSTPEELAFLEEDPFRG